MYEVAGVSINGNKVLIANKFALEIADVTITDDDDDGPYPMSIDISGYGRIEPSDDFGSGFHGRMAMSCSRYSITANENSGVVWIFNINDCADHKMLDRQDGNSRKFENENCGEEEDGNYPGRKIAVGKVEFPVWGGNKPARKRQQQNQDGFSLDCRDEDDSFGLGGYRDEDDSFGEGGSMAIAIRGRWVVAGFSNGTLSKALLPEQFAEPQSSAAGVSSNYLASCSHLPSDEWHHPVRMKNPRLPPPLTLKMTNLMLTTKIDITENEESDDCYEEDSLSFASALYFFLSDEDMLGDGSVFRDDDKSDEYIENEHSEVTPTREETIVC
jgi:hypothetical protein